MIEFKILAMKANIDKLHAIFLLKKNVQADIIKMILGYLLIVALKILKEWKVVITLVEQEYEFTEGQQNYKTGSETIYGGREISIVSKLKMVDSKYFISVSHFSFSFLLCLFLRDLGLGLT